jgi:hypothetical protein
VSSIGKLPFHCIFKSWEQSKNPQSLNKWLSWHTRGAVLLSRSNSSALLFELIGEKQHGGSCHTNGGLSCTLLSIRCCCSSKNLPCRARSITRTHERIVHEQAPQEPLRWVGRREGMGGGGWGVYGSATRKNAITHFPKCFPILLWKQFVAIATCNFVLEFCTRTLWAWD